VTLLVSKSGSLVFSDVRVSMRTFIRTILSAFISVYVDWGKKILVNSVPRFYFFSEIHCLPSIIAFLSHGPSDKDLLTGLE
jgi:hypothetical protein